MPLRIEDVVQLHDLQARLTHALSEIQEVFGELSFGLIRVIDAHNALETRLIATEAKLAATEARLDGEIAIIKRALNLN